VSGAIKPGVLVMFSCYASYLAWLTINQPAFASRVNRAIPLVALSEDEARLVLAKKLLAKRIVEELEPTYPFDRSAVHEINLAARGNPRRLFELADIVLERAVATRAYQIDGDMVRSTLASPEAATSSAPPTWQETEAPAPRPESTPRKETPPAAARPARRSVWGKSP